MSAMRSVRERRVRQQPRLPAAVQIPIAGLRRGEEKPFFTSSSRNPPFDLLEAVQDFLMSEELGSLLVHGVAGSGKSVFGREVEKFL